MTRVLLTLSLLVVAAAGMAQRSTELAAGYYTVVAAYDNSREEYAQRYTATLKEQGYNAQYGLNPSRDLFFVYVQSHANLRTALKGMYEVRKKEEFKDAWVRVVPGVIGQAAEAARPQTIDTEAPANAEGEEAPQAPASKNEEVKPAPISQPTPISPVVEEKKEPAAEEVEVAEEVIRQEYPMTLGNSEVFLSLFNASNNRIIDGDVMVIDTDRGRLLKTVKGNEYLSLPDPKNESGKITLICDVFGYRKLQLDINYRHPEKDTALAHVDMMGLSFVVLFDLVRYRKGDLQTLSHVYFFNDAALMVPESRYEVNQLQQMMDENPRMKVRLHGHTNGHYHGKIIKMGKEKNFFAIGKDAVTTVGSAKDLSYERAEIIKEYLVANGIGADRIEVKGWGGKKPLFDKHSANARKNVRVEVEVLAE
jgi:outer membrane protein OmpA-like peptidoglycan-associated protein